LSDDDSAAAVRWRLQTLEEAMRDANRDRRELWDKKASVTDMAKLAEDMASVRRALYTVAGSILVGAVLFALALTTGGTG
jgi:uncharacterized membrane protein